MRSNYRKGGLFLLPSVVVAIIIAILMDAPISALISIGIFGFVGSIVLILLGDRRRVMT